MADPTAWVALALYFVEQRVDLDDASTLSMVISAADFIDHAVPGFDELAHALEDLAARGWLEVDGSSCALPKEVTTIVAETVEEAGYPSPRALAARLEAFPCFVAPAVPTLDRTVFERAVALYIARMEEASRKSRKV